MDTKGIGAVGVLLVLGLFLGGIGFLPAYEHNVAVQESQPTTGTVVSTDVLVQTDDDGDRTYHPEVVYEYTVDGETHRSSNTFPGRFRRWSGDRSWAEDIAGQYQSGQEVTVHYVPYDTENAYVHNDGLPSSWYFGLGYALLAAIAGAWLVRQGFRRWTQRQLIANTPTETVRSLSMGRSEVTGTAVTGDREPLSAPFSDDDCVVASYEIEEYEDDDDGGGSWQTVEEDVLHTPFFVDDGTGRVLVEPHDEAIYDLDPEDWSETYVDSGDRGPAPISEFVETSPDLGFPADSGGKDNDRKYRQNLIRPEESVYVFGHVDERDDARHTGTQEDLLSVQYREAASNALGSGSMFMLSDDSEAGLIDRREWALWRAPVGGGFVVVALVFAIGMFGPDVGLSLPVLF